MRTTIHNFEDKSTHPPVRFVTISQQIGVTLPSLPQAVAQTLDAHSKEGKWTAWDREIIHQASTQYHLPEEMISRVEQEGYSWLDLFVCGLGELPEDFVVVHRLRDTIRNLAAQGNVVLVGHGAVFMTSDIPGGIHIRLVASLQYRVQNLARTLNVPISEAAERLKQAQRNWTAYLRRYWPMQSLSPETFTATFNVETLDQDHLVRCIASLAG